MFLGALRNVYAGRYWTAGGTVDVVVNESVSLTGPAIGFAAALGDASDKVLPIGL